MAQRIARVWVGEERRGPLTPFRQTYTETFGVNYNSLCIEFYYETYKLLFLALKSSDALSGSW